LWRRWWWWWWRRRSSCFYDTIEGTERHRLEYLRSYRRTSQEEEDPGSSLLLLLLLLLPGPRGEREEFY
jgi:hypothetical protein